MVRPLTPFPHNRLKWKRIKANAMGLNLVAMGKRLMDTPNSKTSINESKADPFKWSEQSFNYALQSNCQKNLRKRTINTDYEDVLFSSKENETTDEGPKSLSLSSYTDTVVHPKKNKHETFIHDQSQDKSIQRKYQMRDEFGNIVRHIKVNKPKTRKATSSKQPNSGATERVIRLVLNIRCLKVGTLTKIFRRSDAVTAQCRFAVDCIEIANAAVSSLTVCIEASEVTSCEWCTVQRLPALFLKTTRWAYHRLRAHMVFDVYEDDSLVWSQTVSGQDENYIILIFEKELAFPEQLILEEIFTEIGRSNNSLSIPIKLSFEEAYDRLKTHTCATKPQALVAFSPSPVPSRCKTATLSVSDGDEDLIELPSSPVHEIKKLVVYPPPPAKRGLTITEEDLECLEEGTFLNDVIIDFYLRFLDCEQQKKEDAVKVHVFSSFFFKHLTQEDHKRPSASGLSVQELRHNRVKTWTKHVNIFEMDFVFVPINQKSHWYLAVICFPGRISQTSDLDVCIIEHSETDLCDQSPPNPMSLFYRLESSENSSRLSQSIDDLNKSFLFDSDDDIETIQDSETECVFKSETNPSKRPCILIMDSLHSRSRSSVVQILQEYLQEEWRVKMGYWQSFGKEVMDGWSPRVPQQDNYTDCGIYLLQYVESFLEDPPQNFHSSMDLNDWFSQRTVKKKRQQIKQLILKLHREQNDIWVTF